MKRFFIPGKSRDSWFQLSPETRLDYKVSLAKRNDLICSGNGCGRHYPLDMLSVDHIMPISMGGLVCDIHNMQLLCFRCHGKKTRKVDNKRHARFILYN